MKTGDAELYFRRTNMSSESAREKIPVIIRGITEVKAKVTRVDNGKIMWVNKENITVTT